MTTVLLTRPEGENAGLQGLLADNDLEVRIRPLIKLSSIETTPVAKQLVMDLDQQDIIIFVSKSAVRFAMPLIENYWPQWPNRLQWLAVGRGTAEVLADHGVNAEFPATAGSEGLLQLTVLDSVSDSKVLIARGIGGRALLADELTDRGATVSYLETYERTPVSYDDWSDLPRDSIVVATSLEALNNLTAQLGQEIVHYRLIVVSERIAAEADGFAETTIAAGASDQALYDAILKYV